MMVQSTDFSNLVNFKAKVHRASEGQIIHETNFVLEEVLLSILSSSGPALERLAWRKTIAPKKQTHVITGNQSHKLEQSRNEELRETWASTGFFLIAWR